MSLQDVLSIIARPQHPIEVGSPNEWSRIETDLRTPLPTDYKEYINIYGTGVIGYLIRPLNPFSKKPTFDFFYQLTFIIETRQWYKCHFGEEWCPYNVYPDPNGLLPWGNTLDGDSLFWYTDGSPDKWKIVIAEVKSKEFEQFSLSTTEFIRDILLVKLDSTILAEVDTERPFEIPS